MAQDVFISHSSLDKPKADTICAALEAEGIGCWIAPRNITPGMDWSEAIVKAIKSCRVMVLVFSANSNRSLQVRREVQRAFEYGCIVVPVRIEDVVPHEALEYYMGSVHWLDAISTPFEPYLDQLVETLHRLLPEVDKSEVNLQAGRLPTVPEPAQRSTPSHNLPQQFNSFIGREKERTEVKRHLTLTRLLTLTAAGGSGKTRLCLQVAAEVLQDYSDGVWLVELAPLSDPALVAQTVASAVGIGEESNRSLEQTLSDYFQSKTALLLLDNCEHLLPACVDLAGHLLAACLSLRIIATSRERLGITGELIYRVPPLSLPALQQPMSVEHLTQYEAVKLFIERAVFVQPTFAVTNSNAPAVAQVCQRLDGIPLAIELAAARVRALPVEQILARLDDCFRLLTGGSRTALPRQQTLQALVDWSYNLLSPQEQTLLRRLSVFVGGWTLEAAEFVASDKDESDSIHPSSFILHPLDVLDLLMSLVDKSMVLYEEQGEQGRYRLLETIGQYSRNRSREAGEAGTAQDCHCDYFLQLAEEAEPQLAGPQLAEWLQRLEVEHDNFRAALTWCLAEGRGGEGERGRRGEEQKEDQSKIQNPKSKIEAGLRLASALWRFWYVRGYFSEGRRWLAAVLEKAEASGPSPARAKALHRAGTLAGRQGDYGEARALLESSLAIRRELGDRLGMAASMNSLGNLASDQVEYAEAYTLYQQSLAIRRELGDKQGIAAALNNLGLIAREQGNYTEAYSLLAESLQLKRELDNTQGIADSLNNLGNIAREQGNYNEAQSLYQQSLQIRNELDDRRGVADSLNNLGLVAKDRGDSASARELYEQSLAIRQNLEDKPGVAASLNNLGIVAREEGDYAQARSLLVESLKLKRKLGNKQSIAETIKELAHLAARQGQLKRAARLYAAAEGLRQAIHSPLPPNERDDYDRKVAEARSADATAFTEAWAEGSALTLEQAIEYAFLKEEDR